MYLKLSEIRPSVWLGVSLLVAMCYTLAPSTAMANELSLPEANARMLMQHPQLHQYASRLKVLRAEAEAAQQRPPVSLSLETSELAGTGEYTGVKSAETTLSVISTLELGDKRQARQRLNSAQYELAEIEREAEARALIGALSAQFIKSLALQEQCSLAKEAANLTQDALVLVQERTDKAAAAEAELLRAKVALIQAKLTLSSCQIELSSSYQLLATAMGQQAADFERLQGDLFGIKPLMSWSQLQDKLAQSPLLQVYSKQRLVQESELNSLQANSKNDLQWQIGVTHFAATDDAALGLGLEVPLFSGKRNRPYVAAARAQIETLSAQQQQAQQQLFAELHSAYQQHIQNTLTVRSLKFEAIPLLERAHQQAQSAYQRGRYSYSEWVNTAQELITTKAQAISAAENIWLSQTTIEQLVDLKF